MNWGFAFLYLPGVLVTIPVLRSWMKYWPAETDENVVERGMLGCGLLLVAWLWPVVWGAWLLLHLGALLLPNDDEAERLRRDRP